MIAHLFSASPHWNNGDARACALDAHHVHHGRGNALGAVATVNHSCRWPLYHVSTLLYFVRRLSNIASSCLTLCNPATASVTVTRLPRRTPIITLGVLLTPRAVAVANL